MNVLGGTFKNLARNQQGQSLVSLLTALPVVLVVSLAVGTMVHATYNEVYRFKVRNESNSLQQDLRTTLDSRAACASSLGGASTFDSAEATSAEGMDMVYQLADGTVVGSNVDLPKYGIRVNSLKFKAFPNGGLDFANDPRVPGNQLQYGELFINTEDLNPASRIAHRDQSLGGVVLSVSSSGDISRCFLLDQGFEMCSQAGGTLDPAGECVLPSLCPMGTFFTGFSAGVPVCKTAQDLMATSCPAGFILLSNGTGASCVVAPTPTPIPTPTPVPSPSPTPTPTPSPSPTATPVVTPTVTPTVTPFPTPPMATPTVTPSPTTSPTPSPTPTATPMPTVMPTPTPIPSPTPTPGPMDPQILYTQQQLASASTDMSIKCRNFLSNTDALDLTATNDVVLTGAKLHYVLPSARNFSADGVGAIDVTVNSAVNVPILKGATDFYVRTQYMDTMFSGGDKYLLVLKNLKFIYTSAGPICASAETIENINGISGKHHIIAKSIGIIDGGAGDMHIYGATVNTVKNFAGDVCLHNGAKILNVTPSVTLKVRTDCP